MKHTNNKILAIFAVALIGFIVFSTSSMADEIPEVDIIPEKPSANDNIEVTINTNNANVEEVYFIFSECVGDTMCSSDQNVSLAEILPNIFSKSITLDWRDDATYMQYTVVTRDSQGWNTYYNKTKVYYEISSPNNGDTNDDNNTPGFEFVALALSIMFISLILYRRKR